MAALGTHVDDIIGIGPAEELDRAESLIEKEVELDKKGRLGKMLGMEAHWEKEQVILTQTTLTENTARNYEVEMIGLKQSLPLNPKCYAKGEELDERVDQKTYQAIVGSLLFISRMT